MPQATWHDSLSTLPEDVALLVVANEFFDALPIRQLVCRGDSWHERLVACQDLLFLPIQPRRVRIRSSGPSRARPTPGAVIETLARRSGRDADLAARIVAQGGAALAIDSLKAPRSATRCRQ
ncbi:SAM-dependent methyltransferase [Sphingomonas sp. MMS24-JH45]